MEKQMNFIDEIDMKFDLFDELLGDRPHQSGSLDHLGRFCGIEIQASTQPVACLASSSSDQPLRSLKTHCTCQKSKCNQKYCPCFKQGRKCTSACICTDCCNKVFAPKKVIYMMGSFEQFCLAPISF